MPSRLLSGFRAPPDSRLRPRLSPVALAGLRASRTTIPRATPSFGIRIVRNTLLTPAISAPTSNNAAANAIVAAAAGVWTIPTSRLNLLYGGALAEHAGEANVYPTSTGLVFPADVQSSNYLAIQIAVLYDSDGAITDTDARPGSQRSVWLPPECRDRERRLYLYFRQDPARHSRSQRPLHGSRIRTSSFSFSTSSCAPSAGS